MGIIFTLLSFTYLFGPIDEELVEKNYLLPNGFSCTNESLIYPPRMFLIGRKSINLKNTKNNKNKLAIIEFLFSKQGFLFTKTSIDITAEEYTTIETEKFSIEDPFYELKNASLLEISWKMTQHLFGKSILDMQLDYDLNSDEYIEYCEKFGIDSIGGVTNLSISSIVAISDQENWIKMKNIELQRTKGGSVLRNTVAIPNFENTLLTNNPELHLLNSSNVIVYTNEFLIKDTLNLVIGIWYQRLGLVFLKNNIQMLQKDLYQIRKYYKSPGNGQISWIYIDRSLSRLENKFEEMINYELEFFDFESPNYINLQNLNFKEKLNRLLEYDLAKSQYLEVKNHTKDRIISMRDKVSDKGEKEEKQAYDRIVAIIGLLAIFQVAPQIFPLVGQNITFMLRIIFLGLFFPALVLIWYGTSYNNNKKVKAAVEIEYRLNLFKKKEILIGNIGYFKNESTQELLKNSKSSFDIEIAELEKKLSEIETEINKIQKN